MKKLKKRFIVPAVVFILGMCALIGAIYVVGESQKQQNRTNAKLNAMTYTERIYGELMEGIGVTDTLKQVVISGDGNINKFYDIAANMMDDSIQSIQIAPNGVVTEIYPEEGNESSKIDLINDSDRGEISRYARDNDTVIMQGPLKLKQGGYGIVVRNPVYLEDKNGQKSFWGFTIVILKVPEIFSDSVEALSNFGYKYSLQKCASPWDDTYEWVYGSKEELNDPVIYDFDVYEDKWRLEILPKSGFYNNNYLIYMFIGGVIIVLLLTGLTAALISINENRKNFKRLAVTDALTGIYNRHGFDEQVEQYMRQNPQKHCVVAMVNYLYTAWKEGVFAFKKQRLEEIMKVVARWYDVNVFWENISQKEVTFTGKMKRYDDFSKVVEMLEMTGNTEFVVRENNIFIREK